MSPLGHIILVREGILHEGKRLEKTQGRTAAIYGGKYVRKAQKYPKEQRTVSVSAVCDSDFGRGRAFGFFVSFGNGGKTYPAGKGNHCI